MEMFVYDENLTERLALIGDAAMTTMRYAPLGECMNMQRRTAIGAYVVQAHYVARTRARGLTVSNVEPMMTGWLYGDHLK